MEWRGEFLSPDSHLPCLDGRFITRQDESNLLSIFSANFCRCPTNELVRMQNVFTNIHSDVSCWVGQGWAQFYLAHWEWILIWEHLFGMWRDNKESKLGVVAQVCQPSILVGTGRRTASSRPAWAIQWFQGSVHNLRKPYFKVRKVRKEPVLNTCFIYGRSCIQSLVQQRRKIERIWEPWPRITYTTLEAKI